MLPKLPIKLMDCEAHGPNSGSELFVVEGDSAAQAVARLRNTALQAVLPLQGKPLNAWKASEKSVGSNPFYAALIDALGGDFASRFQPSLLRYERVILLFDPDADGIHCGTLALLFFYRWMPALIDENRLLIVRAPMMEIVTSGLPGPLLAYSEEEGESHLQSVTAQTRSPVSKNASAVWLV